MAIGIVKIDVDWREKVHIKSFEKYFKILSREMSLEDLSTFKATIESDLFESDGVYRIKMILEANGKFKEFAVEQIGVV